MQSSSARCRQLAGALIFLFLGMAFTSCESSSPTRPSCTFLLTPSTQTVDAQGASVTVTVSTGSQCSWTASTDANWLSIASAASGTGPGTVNLSFSANPAETEREAGLTVSDQSVRFRQRGRIPATCAYEATTTSQRFGADGGRGVLDVMTSAECQWNAHATESWLVLSQTTGTGPAHVEYNVTPYSGTAERSVDIVVADASVRIRQDPPAAACEYNAAPVDFQLHWHHTSAEFRVATGGGCAWTLKSTVDWLTVPGPQDRQGEAAITFLVGIYTADSLRSAPIEVRWPTSTAGQNIWVTQGGCRFGFGPDRTFGPAGGSGQATVVTQPVTETCNNLNCPWSATTTVGWIKITNPTGAGEDFLHYTVDPNPGPGTRTGEIILQGRKLTVTQTN